MTYDEDASGARGMEVGGERAVGIGGEGTMEVGGERAVGIGGERMTDLVGEKEQTRCDSRCPSRRRFVASLGSAAAVVLAGCSGAAGGPTYEDGEVGNVSGEARTAEEAATAKAFAQQEVDETVAALDSITIERHEFGVEDGYVGPTVRGVVENIGDKLVDTVEVRVRVYDDEGAQLDRYLDSTGDLAPGATWQFGVVVLEAPADVADYDIAVLGTPT